MKRIYLIPNMITAFSVSCGLFVIFKTCMPWHAQDPCAFVKASAILLLISVIADFADGAVARLIKAESDFGVQFDSLADAVTFGVAPALVTLKGVTIVAPDRIHVFFLVLAAMMYSLCGLVRLVRYNLQGKRLDEEDQRLKRFIGLPIPAAACAVLSLTLYILHQSISHERQAEIISLALIFLGYLMVSRWKFPSIRTFYIKVPFIYLILTTGIFAMTLLYGILDYFVEAFCLCTWMYVFLSWGRSWYHLFKGKKEESLEEDVD